MTSRRLLHNALASLDGNAEQARAARTTSHCVVLAGPGSGKTKTLTTAMARTMIEDVAEPRGVACITYNNECAYELEERLAALGVERGERVFIGTVHSFALTQIILPYGRCVLPDWINDLSVASPADQEEIVALAHAATIGGNDNPKERWKFATEKRKTIIDRGHPDWRGRNEELADFVEAYEAELRRRHQIDFDDMPLIAYNMVAQHPWIRDAIRAKFPVLFVDEYQDLGHALHQLVVKLCLESGIRLFAVGDVDQSIYGFTGAEPSLLVSLTERRDVTTLRLRFNYRCGTHIINASMAALGEERDYAGPDGAHDGLIEFHPVKGTSESQAEYILDKLLPTLQEQGYSYNDIGILYRWAKHCKDIVKLGEAKGIPLIRADNQALIRRGSAIARFIENCARWATGGWKTANPRFLGLHRNAVSLVYGALSSEKERMELERELIAFLRPIEPGYSAHRWLLSFRQNVLLEWKNKARSIAEQWDDLDEIIERIDPEENGRDLTMAAFSGDTSGSGALNLSTFHSSKGREFRAVILLGMDKDVIPNSYSLRNPKKLREDRREFYVAVTRAMEQLHVVFTQGYHSPFVTELYRRSSA